MVLGLMLGVGAAGMMAAMWFVLPLMGQPDEVVGAMDAYWLFMSAFLIPFSVLTAFKSAIVLRHGYETALCACYAAILIPMAAWVSRPFCSARI